MSDYVSKKAIRYKLGNLSEEMYEKYDKYRVYNSKGLLKKEFGLENEMEFETGYDEGYLDITLKETYGTISGDFGTSRNLTQEEIDKYLKDFQKVIPNITANVLRHVFYCYYNGVDAPNCYDIGEWDND